MPNNETTTKFKADISQLKASMQEAARQVRLANSEFKAATAGMNDWASSADGLTAKIKQLDSVLSAQKSQLASLEKQYELTAQAQGKDSKGAQELLIRINNQRAAIGKTESQLESYEAELRDCANSEGRFADQTEKAAASSKKASDGFTVMKGALANLVADGIRAAINGTKELAKDVLKVGTNFEKSMSQVESVSGASAKELEKLKEKAKEMGSSTAFTASEAADAMNYMAMAGWKTKDMLNGIEGVMNLASASGEDLATTSDIVTDALTAMGYSAKDSGHLADVMAKASANANTNVSMMGQTFKYAAPLVGTLGYNMEDTAVAIGLMANAGIKGEKAGTALRSIFTRMSAPPKAAAEAMKKLGLSLTDSEGKMKPFADVMVDLRSKFKGLSETQQTQLASAIAGKEAMSGFLAVVKASPKDFESLTKAVNDSKGAAKEMAETKLDNLSGDVTLLKSAFEGLQLQIFEGANTPLRGLVQTITNQVIPAISGLIKGTDGASAKFAEVVSGIVQNILTGIQNSLDEVIEFGTTLIIDLAKGILNGLPQAIATTSQAVQTLVNTLVEQVGTLLDEAPVDAIVDSFVDMLVSMADALPIVLEKLVPHLGEFVIKLGAALVKNSPRFLAAMIQLWSQLPLAMAKAIDATVKKIPGAIKSIVGAWDNLKVAIPKIWNSIKTSAQAIILGKMVSIFKAAVSKIQHFFADLGKKIEDGFSAVYDIGADIVRGLWNGINDQVKWIKQKLEGFGKSVLGALKDFFGIHSPSTLMRDQVGVYLAEGVVAGVVKAESKSIKVLKASAARMTKGYMDGFVSSLSYASSRVTNTAKGLISNALGTMLSGGFNFSETANKASKNFSDSLTKQVEYLTNRMSYENEQKLAAFDSTISNYEKMRDSKVKVAEKSRDREIKRLEAERDDAVKRIEKDRDKRLKELESKLNSNVDSKTKSLQKKRDARVDALEKERDAKVEALEKKRDKEKDKKKKKKLADEIKEIKKSYTEKIKTAKKGAEEEIDNLKSSDKKKNELIKQEISQLKENSAKEVNATKNSYDKQIKATKNNTTKLVNNIKKQYEKLINSQKTAKNNYSSATSKMLTEFTNALNEYRTQAEDIVNTTIDGITDTYQAKYDALIDKQDDLIDKLISAGDLFEVSGAGVMTINDISMQVQGMKDYADKLQQIKSKVSKELFDEISKMDMKEGSAYIDRLLAYSEDELQTYNDLYTEKLDVAKELSENLYQSDFDEVASEYTGAIEKAFDGLPAELEALGKESLSGFISGLTEGTDYMTGAIKQMIGSMISTFKTQLGIHSPSKVLMQLGEFTGEGFAEGLKKTIGLVTDSATSLVDVTATSLDGIKGAINTAKSSVASGASSSSVVTNNYNLVQNNNSPKPLTALETYQARRQQIAMVKAFTS